MEEYYAKWKGHSQKTTLHNYLCEMFKTGKSIETEM